MWEQDYKGGIVGYTTCLTAGVARQLVLMMKRHKPLFPGWGNYIWKLSLTV